MTGETRKLIGSLLIEELKNNPLIVTDSKKYLCNNWRKLHKLPKRRKGSRIVVFKIKFEHNTTKKQKRRYKKKHYFNPNDITIN